MEKNHLQTTFSIITKEEEIQALDHNIIPNTLVMEITHPFPAYYSDNQFIDSNSKPQTIIFILKNIVDSEFFYRKLGRIMKYSEFNFGADLAELKINNKTYQGIRVHSLLKYQYIKDLSQYFIDEGFSLHKYQQVKVKSLIRIHKFINLKYTNGYYINANNKHFIYLGINKELTWKQFEHITLTIRHNFAFKKFDAAIGVFFHSGELEDVIRIYTKDIDNEDIIQLKTMYDKQLLQY